jgi:hypothetical protein
LLFSCFSATGIFFSWSFVGLTVLTVENFCLVSSLLRLSTTLATISALDELAGTV